jgi:exodeoxyribonuclease VII small subunit
MKKERNGSGQVETGPDASRPLERADGGERASTTGAEGELRFEDALDRLETLVEEMESGDLALEETIARFEEGQKLLRTCGQLLDRAEQRVKTILKRADGALATEPWDEEATGDEGA